MMRREIPNRIAQATVQAVKVRVIIIARKVKEKNNVSQLDQISVKLDWPTGHNAERNEPVPPIVHQIGNGFR